MPKPLSIKKDEHIEIQTFGDPFREKVVKIPVTLDGDQVVMRFSEAMFPLIQTALEEKYRKHHIILKFTRY